ncbi:hypothetical protein [Rhizobium sp. Leaf262]|uniref:hypothetical protein n=1 Tax=Rhizobium sp. Leaf262 TaxID=1736312 RepID=UPI000713DAEC|nr:hypothetical protein [Rhizobium sp. Leaf262]KQO79464.1 hypothetical protein ASF29_23425 [Rhizobium sp. Leaf262]
MSDTTVFNINIFIGLDKEDNPEPPQEPAPSAPKRLDPISELKAAAGPVVLQYKVRFQNSNIPFLDFSRGDRRWLGLLLQDLQRIYIASPTDAVIMGTKASVRNRYQQAQTWQEFIDGMVADKVTKGFDFTAGQLKHLPKLIEALSKGTKLAGCGRLEFVDENGKVL